MDRDSSGSQALIGGVPGRPAPHVPDHELLRRIGRGSYGEVWLARNVMGTYRAVKVVYRDSFCEERPFNREFEGIRKFEPISRANESQVDILHVGRGIGGDHFYYVMELADDQLAGQEIDPDQYAPKTLRSELRNRGRLPFAECLKIGLALTTALEDLHRPGLIHRDIKPSNVIFVNGRPKLADIGLVASLGEECTFVGTEGYSAPEGPGQMQADIYALGKVLYEMCTGLEVRRYPNLPDNWATSPEQKEFNELNHVVLRACEGDAEQRYQTAEEMRSDLELLKSGKSLRLFGRIQRAYERLKLIAAFAGSVLALSPIILGVWFYRGRLALRESLLAQARLERKGEHLAGWFSTNWALVQRAAAIGPGPDVNVREQAAAALAGLDAQPIVTLWDTAGGSVAFSSDGTLLVGGTMGSPALLISTNGNKQELPLRAEGPVCWPPGGVPLQFSAPSNSCLLQEVRTGSVLQRFALATGEQVNRTVRPVLAISPEGSRVAAAVSRAEQGRVVVWDAVTGAVAGDAPGYARALAFSEDGTVLAAGDREGSIAVFTFPGTEKVLDLPPRAHAAPVHCLAVARDRVVREAKSSRVSGWLVAASYKGGEVVIWDLHTRMPRAVCRGSNWSVTSLAFHPDGLKLASAGRTDEVRLWDVTSGELLLRIAKVGASDTRALAFTSDGTRLAWSTEAQPPLAETKVGELNPKVSPEEFPRSPTPPSVAVWVLNPHRGIQILRGLTTSARWVWFSRDSHLVGAVSDDWHVAVWELPVGRLVAVFEVPNGAFADSGGGCFDANGKRFAFAAGTEARLYELATGRILNRWHLPESGLMDHLQFDAAGRLIFARRNVDTSTDKKWRVYELAADGQPVLLHEQTETNWEPWDMALAAGGERFFVTTHSNKFRPRPDIRAYDVASGRELWQVVVPGLHTSEVLLDPTGRWFAYQLDTNYHWRVVRLTDFRETGISPPHCRAIGPSGGSFAVHGPEGFQVLGPGSVTESVPLGSDWSRSFQPSYSPDGKFLAWGTFEGAVLVAEIEEVRRRLAGLRQ